MSAKQPDMVTQTSKIALPRSRPTLRAGRRQIARAVEGAIRLLLLACGLVSIVTTAGIILVLLVETIEFFREVTFAQFFLDTQWTPVFVDKHFGIWPLVAGTALTSAVALIVSLPLGLLSAIYLSEYASPRVRSTLKPLLEILAGIPTVVYGYFALRPIAWARRGRRSPRRSSSRRRCPAFRRPSSWPCRGPSARRSSWPSPP